MLKAETTGKKHDITVVIIDNETEEVVHVDGGILVLAKKDSLNEKGEHEMVFRAFGDEQLMSGLATVSFVFMQNLLNEINQLHEKMEAHG